MAAMSRHPTRSRSQFVSALHVQLRSTRLAKGRLQCACRGAPLTRQAVEGACSSKDAAKALGYDVADAAAEALHTGREAP